MARNKGSANLAASLEVLAGAPLDARETVPTKADLTASGNFPYFYIGMETYVVADNKKYRLVGDDPTDLENWEEVGSGGGGGGSYTAGDGINISEEGEISTDNLQEGDMADIITPLPTPGGGGGGDAELETDVTSNLAVGAIASGTTLVQGTTFTEFVQKLLITEIAPTIGFSISKSGNVAQGTSYTETLTVNVSNMGTAKKIKTIEWYEGSTLKQTDTIDSTTIGSWTYTMPTATTDTTTFKAIVTYTKSNDADDTQTKQASINFYYNKFYGGVSDLNPTEATVEALTSALATAKGGTYSFTVSAGRICYAYPKSLGALTSIKDGNGFSLFDSFTRTEQTYTQAGQSVAYYRYVLTDPTTVSSYNVIFA